MELQKGMIICQIQASPPDVYKIYSVVDFDDREQAVYGTVSSSFRGDALIVKSAEGWTQPEIQLLTQEQETLSILRQYVEF